MLPEFHKRKAIHWQADVTKQPMAYDIILGEDLLKELGLIINYNEGVITWDDASVAMKDVDAEPPLFFCSRTRRHFQNNGRENA